MGLAVDGANRHDMKLVRATVDSLPVPRPEPSPEHPQGMCLDKGYNFEEVRRTLEEFGFTAHIHSRGEEAKAIKQEAGFKARRWVVERPHGWLNRFRRILVRWDKSPDNYIALPSFRLRPHRPQSRRVIRIGSKWWKSERDLRDAWSGPLGPKDRPGVGFSPQYGTQVFELAGGDVSQTAVATGIEAGLLHGIH